MSSGYTFTVFSSARIAISTVASGIFTAALFALLSWCRSCRCGAPTIAGGHWILCKNRQYISYSQLDN